MPICSTNIWESTSTMCQLLGLQPRISQSSDLMELPASGDHMPGLTCLSSTAFHCFPLLSWELGLLGSFYSWWNWGSEELKTWAKIQTQCLLSPTPFPTGPQMRAHILLFHYPHLFHQVNSCIDLGEWPCAYTEAKGIETEEYLRKRRDLAKNLDMRKKVSGVAKRI